MIKKEDIKHIQTKPNPTGFKWNFSDKNDGSFFVENADYLPPLYFPLLNSYGMKTYVTPELKGDICSSFDTYLTAATVTEELHRNVSSRNFWIKEKGKDPWSITGNSVFQKTGRWKASKDTYSLEGKLGAFNCKRTNTSNGIEASISTFVPELDYYVELLKVKIKNTGVEKITFSPTYAIPVFARSAENFRDHRQVTTMFQKNFFDEHGVRIKPNIVHDESGHNANKTNYIVLGFDKNGGAPVDKWILVEDFIGTGGTFDNPEAVYNKQNAPQRAEEENHGKEAVGAFRFKDVSLKPGEETEFVILHGITDNEDDINLWKEEFGTSEKFDVNLSKTLKYWQTSVDTVSFKTSNHHFDNWVKWINYQVKCRQVFGNSFLPDFGYGRGGRGWRDLWQDLLSIFLVDPESAKSEMLNNFKGIRIDGSNATIIGTKPGEFKADRNDIPRTWCDHGAWPVFILNFYLNQTGDYSILNNKIPYWKDQFTHRSKKQDKVWQVKLGNLQLDLKGEEYKGSLFEHVLLQQLSAFYNVGDHNILLLEGGDWNDTYDMAGEKGESVCFHNFYANNLKTLSETLINLKQNGINKIEILQEALVLLDNLPGQNTIDYNSPKSKQIYLQTYFESVKHKVSGIKESISIDSLINDLELKAKHSINNIQKNEQITTKTGLKFFNGHYDNTGKQIGGDSQFGIRMDLTSQVMPILCNVSDKEQTKDSFTALGQVLKDKNDIGLRLCTDFKQLDLNVGRVTGFVYGNKEHGSKWMQQNIMLAYGLYQQGFVKEGHEVFNEVYKISVDTEKAKIFPGVPSYFNNENKGAYAYLTGSSSWFLLTLITQVFGVRGKSGDLYIEPKLVKEQFNDEGIAIAYCNFQNYKLKIKIKNNDNLDFGEYQIGKVIVNQGAINVSRIDKQKTIINKILLKELNKNKENEIVVILTK